MIEPNLKGMHNYMHNPMSRSFIANATLEDMVIGARVSILSPNPELAHQVGTIINDERTEYQDATVLLDNSKRILGFYYQEMMVIDERYDI